MLGLLDACTQRLDRISADDGHWIGRDHGTGVHAVVDVVHRRSGRGSAGREQIFQRMRTGELGQRRRMDVHDAVREAGEERGAQELHVARAHYEVDAVPFEPVGHRRVARLAVGMVAQEEDTGSDTRASRALERSSVGSVGRDRNHRKLHVEQRLQVRALPAHEDADHVRTMVPIWRPSPGPRTTAT